MRNGDIVTKKRELEAELRSIDRRYSGEDLPPEMWNRWQVVQMQLDTINSRISEEQVGWYD